MKQNSSILFHSMRHSLRNRYFRATCAMIVACLPFVWPSSAVVAAAAAPEYVASFDPDKGWKPAQRDLTEIFLQLAGSLEFYGSPEPYLRHVATEHARIEALFRQKFGKEPRSHRPDYMTDAYIDRLSANWKLLSPKLGLEPYAKDFGNTMRDAILGTRRTGTIVVDILNQHQSEVLNAMTGQGSGAHTGFESLRVVLMHRLELDKSEHAYERYEVAHRDAVSFGLDLKGTTTKLFARIDAGLKPEAAAKVKAFLLGVIIDTGAMAQSELEAGIAERVIDNSSPAGR